MLVHKHHTDVLVTPQPLSLVGEAWTTEVVRRLAANLTEQALGLKPFQRVRGLATPHDLLRGLLAYVRHSAQSTCFGCIFSDKTTHTACPGVRAGASAHQSDSGP